MDFGGWVVSFSLYGNARWNFMAHRWTTNGTDVVMEFDGANDQTRMQPTKIGRMTMLGIHVNRTEPDLSTSNFQLEPHKAVAEVSK